MRRVFHPFAPYVGLRYVRARTHKFFVSFITWVSLLGVGLGVAALIVILSVMNGFEGELRDQLLALSAHARVVPAAGASGPTDQAGWDAVAARLRTQPGVVGVAPYVEVQALAVHQPDMLPVVLRGIDPASESSVSDIAKVLRDGRLKDLSAGDDHVHGRFTPSLLSSQENLFRLVNCHLRGTDGLKSLLGIPRGPRRIRDAHYHAWNVEPALRDL